MKHTEIDNALKVLTKQQIILYPTDTVWGIGCDATSKKAVKKIFNIKKRTNSKSLVILVNNFEMLERYVEYVPEIVRSFLSTVSTPTTIIYRAASNLAPNVIAKNKTVAIRIVKDKFCEALIMRLGKPIVSTSANLSGESSPGNFNEINSVIIESTDYQVNLDREKENNKSSMIVEFLKDDKINIIRN